MTATTTRSGPPPGGPEQPASPAPGTASDGTFTHRQVLTIIGGLLLGMFLASLDQTVVSTAIRTIADDLDGYSLQAWATTAFLITSTIVVPLYGKLSDQFGRKPLYLTAITLFVIGSVLCTFSASMYQLAAFRAVQGLGAGGLISLVFAILGDIVSPRERSKYQAYFMAVFGTSSVIGPVIGGSLAGVTSIAGIAGWRWIFLLNVPLGILAFVVVYKVLHLPHTRGTSKVDWQGALSLVLFLVPLLVVAEQGRTWGWTSTSALVCYVVAAIGFAAFLTVETQQGPAALLPLRLFRQRTFAVGMIASSLIGIGMFGGLVLLPQYLQVVKGSSPTTAGYQMLPLVLGIMISSATTGVLISRTGRYKVFPVIGTATMATVFLFMTRIDADTSYWQIAPLLLGIGLGLGLNMQPMILAVQNAANPREMGVATSSVTFFRQIGGTVGVTLFFSVLFSILGSRVASQYATAATDPAFRAALAANPQQAQMLKAGSSGALENTQFLTKIDPVLAHPFLEGFAGSLSSIFFIAAGIMVIAFVVTFFLPELALRTTSGAQEQARLDAAAKAAGDGHDAQHDQVVTAGAASAVAQGAITPASLTTAPGAGPVR